MPRGSYTNTFTCGFTTETNFVLVFLWSMAVAEEYWDMQAVIAKSNDDVRQEVFIMQLIAFYEVCRYHQPSMTVITNLQHE